MSALRSVALVMVMVTVMVSACAEDDAPSDDQPLPLTPDTNGCSVVAALDGAQAQSETFGPYVFGTGTFCLRLDASQLRRGHLMASTRYEAGDASGFTLALTTPDGSSLATGWDVSVGSTDTMTFANLEMAVAGGTVLDVRLVVAATDKTSSVNVALFDPLE